MFNSSILTNATTPKFRATALREYWHSINENYSKLIQSLTSFINVDDILFDTFYVVNGSNLILTAEGRAYWASISKFNLASIISMPFGYVQLETILKALVYNLISDEFPDIDFTDEKYNASGTPINMVSPDDIEMMIAYPQQALHASVACEALLEACEGDDLASRVTIFRDRLSTVFSNAYTDLSGSLSVYLDLLKIPDVDSIIDNITARMNVQQLSQGDASVPTIGSTDIYQYTGANPLSAYDGLQAAGVVVQTGAAIARVAWTAVKSIANIASNIFKSAWNQVKINTSNPVDIKIIDDSNACAYACTNTCFYDSLQEVTVLSPFQSEVNPVDFNNFLAQFNQSHAGTAHKFKFFCGEVIFSYDTSDYSYQDDAIYLKGVNVQIRPNFIDLRKVASLCSKVADGEKIIVNFDSYDTPRLLVIESLDENNYQYFADLCKLCSSTDVTLDVTDSNEAEMMQALCFGRGLCTAILTYGVYQVRNIEFASISTEAKFICKIPRVEYDAQGNLIGDIPSVTNLDFFEQATGFNNTYFSSGFGVNFSSTFGDSDVWRACSVLLTYQAADEYIHPLDYGFIPYTKNDNIFSPARFEIKTDSENAQAATRFMDLVVSIAVVVAAAATALVAIKAISTALVRRSYVVKSSLESKLARGEKLSLLETLRYNRANKRIIAASNLCGALQSSVTYYPQDGSNPAFGQIINLIK